MSEYRFRTGEAGELVLQVLTCDESDYGYSGYTHKANWRDATVADIPVFDPFKSPHGKNYAVSEADHA